MAAFSAVSLASSLAFGQPVPPKANSSAEKLFEEGRRLMADKQFTLACQKFKASQSVEAGIGVSLWLADCFESSGQSASAWTEFVRTSELAAERGDPRESVARARAEALLPRLSKIVFVVPPSSAASFDVECDGTSVPSTRWVSGQYVDPGLHHLRAIASGRAFWEADLVVGSPADVKSVTVPSPPVLVTGLLPVPPAVPPSPPPRSATGFALAATSMGVGLVGLGLGIYLGVEAKHDNDQSNPLCGATACSQTGHDLRTAALHDATGADVAFAVAAAGVVGGVVLFVWSSGHRSSAAARASAALLGYPVSF